MHSFHGTIFFLMGHGFLMYESTITESKKGILMITSGAPGVMLNL